MKGLKDVGWLCILLLVALFASGDTPSRAPPGALDRAGVLDQPTEARVLESYGRLPIRFEANRGQTDATVDFLSRGNGYSLFLTPGEAVLASRGRGGRHHGDVGAGPAGAGTILRVRLVGANPRPRAAALEEQPGKVHYFVGTDSAQWRTDVPTYGRVSYQGVYPGVDLVYYGNQQQLEFDFVVAAGADPGAIVLGVQGVDRLVVDAEGDLVLEGSGLQTRLRRPFAYQDAGGARQEVAASYVLEGEHRFGFRVGAYDASKPLVIDPVLVYATYLGPSDYGHGIAVDASGHAYVTGYTNSPDFPTTPGAVQSASPGSTDAFVTKLTPAGDALVYSTFLGGAAGHGQDQGYAIAVDSTGHAYVTGYTNSPDFPTTPGAIQSTRAGFGDAFVTKLNPHGSALVYSTYLGGSGAGDEAGRGIAVDASGSAYVTGETWSADFPVTPGAFQAVVGLWDDVFVTKLDATGRALVYSTYVGGNGRDEGYGIAVDGAGSAYVAGWTFSSDFPTTAGAFQPAIASNNWDAFVAKVNASGSELAYSSYLGGRSDGDFANAIAVGPSGDAYVTGMSWSSDFPTTSGAFQTTYGGAVDTFVARVNAAGSGLVYSTYLGGSGSDSHTSVVGAIAVDASGSAYVTGATLSTNFPTTPGAFQSAIASSGWDAFATKLNPAGSGLVYSTYLGGGGDDAGYAIAVDAAGNAYVTGRTTSDFPTTPGTFQSTCCGTAFVAKIGDTTPAADLAIAKTDSPDPVAPGDDITYTVVVTNHGPNGAQGVELRDEIPANTTFRRLDVPTLPQGWSCSTVPPVGERGQVVCRHANLPSGPSSTFVLVVHVDPGTAASTTIQNTVTIGSDTTADPDRGNNQAAASTGVGAAACLADIQYGVVIPPAGASIDPAGQTDTYTFCTTGPGDRVLARMSRASGTIFPAIRIPDGTKPDGTQPCGQTLGNPTAEVASCSLASSGPHTLLAYDTNGAATGPYALYLQRLNNPGNAVPITLGQALTGSIDSPAEMDTYTFSGAAGDKVLVRMSRAGGSFFPAVRVYGPAGDLLCDKTLGNPTAEVASCSLASSGRHTLLAYDTNGAATGPYALYLQRLDNPGNAVPIAFGVPLTGPEIKIGLPAEMDTYTFSGARGDKVLARMSRAGGSFFPALRVYGPAGDLLCDKTLGNPTAEVASCSLASSGRHTLLAYDTNGAATGPYALYLQRLNNPGNAVPIAFPQTLAGSIDSPAEMDTYTFSAVAWDLAQVSMKRTSGAFFPAVRVYGPAGDLLCDKTLGNPAAEIASCALSSPDRHTILTFDTNGTGTGRYELAAGGRRREGGGAVPAGRGVRLPLIVTGRE